MSKGQLEKLQKAYKNNSAITLRLAKNDLDGPDELMLTKSQINKIDESIKNGTGTDIEISKTQIRKAIKEGGSLWTLLVSLGTKLLPYATKTVGKVAPHLATGALSALGSLGIDKMFGKGIDISFKYLNLLSQVKNKFTQKTNMRY